MIDVGKRRDTARYVHVPAPDSALIDERHGLGRTSSAVS